jgi:hypothetical protein
MTVSLSNHQNSAAVPAGLPPLAVIAPQGAAGLGTNVRAKEHRALYKMQWALAHRFACTDCGGPCKMEGHRCWSCWKKSRGTLEERFWAKVDKRGPDECWPWIGGLDRKGYGRLSATGEQRLIKTHRLAWELANGRPVPAGLCVCHTCDRPECCNARHLWIGTIADNDRDKVIKGRVLRGEALPNSKLSEDSVREIRRRYARGGILQRELAQEFGISANHVSVLVCRLSWKHIT